MSNFTHTIRGKAVDDGKGGRQFAAHDPEAFHRWLLRFLPDTEIILGAKQHRDKHSPQQRGYLHGVVIPEFLDGLGMEDSKENHDLMYIKLKEKFGPCEMKYGKDGQAGEVLVIPKSGREYTTTEMSQLIDGAIRWLGEWLGRTVPPPQRVIMDGAGI